MSASVERVFLEALEDLRAGRIEEVEHYLELVPASGRAQLADLLAMYFASRQRPLRQPQVLVGRLKVRGPRGQRSRSVRHPQPRR